VGVPAVLSKLTRKKVSQSAWRVRSGCTDSQIPDFNIRGVRKGLVFRNVRLQSNALGDNGGRIIVLLSFVGGLAQREFDLAWF